MVIKLLGSVFVARSGAQDVLRNQKQVLRWSLLHVPSVSLLSHAQFKSLPRIEALTSVGWVSWPSFSGHSLTLPKLALEVLGPTTCSL